MNDNECGYIIQRGKGRLGISKWTAFLPWVSRRHPVITNSLFCTMDSVSVIYQSHDGTTTIYQKLPIYVRHQLWSHT